MKNLKSDFKKETIQSSENNIEKEKVFSTYKPEFDQQLGIPLSLEKEEWPNFEKALNSSYGPGHNLESDDLYKNRDINGLESQLDYIKNFLNSEFADDISYNLLSNEIKRLKKPLEALEKSSKIMLGPVSSFVEEKQSKLSEGISSYERTLYKTIRGFLEFRIESMENHLKRLKNEKLKGTQNEDQIQKLRGDINSSIEKI